jgi:hypothetical protein|eukprot:1006528-Prymnesium_polylepis.1
MQSDKAIADDKAVPGDDDAWDMEQKIGFGLFPELTAAELWNKARSGDEAAMCYVNFCEEGDDCDTKEKSLGAALATLEKETESANKVPLRAVNETAKMRGGYREYTRGSKRAGKWHGERQITKHHRGKQTAIYRESFYDGIRTGYYDVWYPDEGRTYYHPGRNGRSHVVYSEKHMP